MLLAFHGTAFDIIFVFWTSLGLAVAAARLKTRSQCQLVLFHLTL